MIVLSRGLAPAILAVALGFGAVAPVQAQDDLVRVLVSVADVVFRGSTPYYRQGDYGYDDRLTVQRDRYGRPVYYRSVPRDQYYGNNGNYNGNYNGNNGHGNNDNNRRVKCNKHGKCKVEYYDPRYSQHPHNGQNNHDRYDQAGRYWDGRQWRYRDQYSNRDRDHEEHDRRDHDGED